MKNLKTRNVMLINSVGGKRLLASGLVVLLLAGLSACGNKEKKPGQSLARVNGEEITVLQLNEELQRSGVQSGQQEQASKQLLESLIDRQLLINEATKEKLDRDPQVSQAIERAKAMVLAQAYLQRRVGQISRPTKEEVEAYYNQHPEFFARRKLLEMRELVLASSDMSAAVKTAADNAKSLDEVAQFLDAQKVKYGRAQLARTSADLPPELSAKLLAMPKGQLFIIKEGARSMLIAISDIKESPVALEGAAPQIEQFLANKKSKDMADAELKRLRAAAKIEYLNKAAGAAEAAPASASAASSAPAAAAAPASTSDSTERGVAGLK